jgi:hypothetical protein
MSCGFWTLHRCRPRKKAKRSKTQPIVIQNKRAVRAGLRLPEAWWKLVMTVGNYERMYGDGEVVYIEDGQKED